MQHTTAAHTIKATTAGVLWYQGAGRCGTKDAATNAAALTPNALRDAMRPAPSATPATPVIAAQEAMQAPCAAQHGPAATGIASPPVNVLATRPAAERHADQTALQPVWQTPYIAKAEAMIARRPVGRGRTCQV